MASTSTYNPDEELDIKPNIKDIFTREDNCIYFHENVPDNNIKIKQEYDPMGDIDTAVNYTTKSGTGKGTCGIKEEYDPMGNTIDTTLDNFTNGKKHNDNNDLNNTDDTTEDIKHPIENKDIAEDISGMAENSCIYFCEVEMNDNIDGQESIDPLLQVKKENADNVSGKDSIETQQYDESQLAKLFVQNEYGLAGLNNQMEAYKKEKEKEAVVQQKEFKYFCDVCEYKCMRKENLTRHKMIHTNEYRYFCDECNYKCRQRWVLTQHKLTHTNEYKHFCDECDYKCRRKEHLNQHKKIHNGEYKYFCDECNYKCRQKGNFTEHKMIHSQEYKYFCDECDFKCRQKGNLNAHKRIHSKEFKFFCDECDYKCRQKGNLNTHKMIHAGEFRYFCLNCDFKCRWKKQSDRHHRINGHQMRNNMEMIAHLGTLFTMEQQQQNLQDDPSPKEGEVN